MPTQTSFEYAVVRVVPRVERDEFINAGVIVYCLAKQFLEAKVQLNVKKLLVLAPDCDDDFIREHLEAIVRISAGGTDAGPIGLLPQKERWHWLVAPRSTVIQVGPVHSGLCETPAASLDKLMKQLVG